MMNCAAINHYYADIAASVQEVTEDLIVNVANEVHRQTGLNRLCLAGGLALNSVANARILREMPFEAIYIQPSAGDGGGHWAPLYMLGIVAWETNNDS